LESAQKWVKEIYNQKEYSDEYAREEGQGTRAVLFVVRESPDDFSDLTEASESTPEFRDNPIDDWGMERLPDWAGQPVAGFAVCSRTTLFNLFWSVEKHDANPTNSGMIGLAKSALICG